MSDESLEFRKIENRCRELREWIQHKAPQCLTEQKHLEEGTQERGYWAHGYLSALQDVVCLFSKDSVADQGYDAGQKYAA
ncbi:MAG TPA: hypothetical protein VGL00_02905 [Terracidiphilus sp.]|jgi:hypothetical protein